MSARGVGGAAQVLLIEPDNLVRGTVASVCRDMQLVRMHQATSLVMGEQFLQSRPVQGLMLSLAEGDAAMDLLARLRASAFACAAAIPVVVMAATCSKDQVVRLKALDVRRLLLQPFRLRDVIHTVEQVWPLVESAVQPMLPSDMAAA